MKKGLAFTLTILGIIGLGYGVVMLFSGSLGSTSVWASTVLGIIFFTSGIGLLKSTKE